MKDVLIYTNDNHVALYKYGQKNQTFDRHRMSSPLSPVSKNREHEAYQVDMPSYELPFLLEDLRLTEADLVDAEEHRADLAAEERRRRHEAEERAEEERRRRRREEEEEEDRRRRDSSSDSFGGIGGFDGFGGSDFSGGGGDFSGGGDSGGW